MDDLSRRSIAAMIGWLITYNNLWDRTHTRADRENAVLYNLATVATLFIGVCCMYAVLMTVTLLDMPAAATASLDLRRSTLYQSRLQDPLPARSFDLVISMLAVHHLSGPDKADLFHRVAGVLTGGGRIVLADLVVPDDPDDVVTPIDGIEDVPSSLSDQLRWLAAAGLTTEVTWQQRDLAVTASTKAT